MNTLSTIQSILQKSVKSPSLQRGMYFKTGPGDYAEHDQFLGISVPNLRKIAQQYPDLSLVDLYTLLASAINEERLLALIILVNQYQKADTHTKEKIYQFYRDNLQQVNNWNLVDASAPEIMGAHLFHADKSLLIQLANSNNLWERRIAIVSTWYFIRKQSFDDTIRIATLLLQDKADLIHKATGWMLREMGKRDQQQLILFLEKFATKMPRTMLRYAIERFSPDERKAYLALKA